MYTYIHSVKVFTVLVVCDSAVPSSFVPPMLDSLPCTEETQAILAGYIVQGEFGDYDVADHTPGYLDDYPFVLGKVSWNLE